MKYYQIEFRESGEQMLWSKDTEDECEAYEIFENAEFTGKCDVIELHEYKYDVPTCDYNELLETKTKNQ